jgi:hypothetical protein
MPRFAPLSSPLALRGLLTLNTCSAPQERKDRALLAPWIKHLWEAYRTILEVLRNNSKLESMYHVRPRLSVARLACIVYSRTPHVLNWTRLVVVR